MGEVMIFDPASPDLGKACLAKLQGPFLSIESASPVTVRCALTEGHDGEHFIRISWHDPDGPAPEGESG